MSAFLHLVFNPFGSRQVTAPSNVRVCVADVRKKGFTVNSLVLSLVLLPEYLWTAGHILTSLHWPTLEIKFDKERCRSIHRLLFSYMSHNFFLPGATGSRLWGPVCLIDSHSAHCRPFQGDQTWLLLSIKAFLVWDLLVSWWCCSAENQTYCYSHCVSGFEDYCWGS